MAVVNSVTVSKVGAVGRGAACPLCAEYADSSESHPSCCGRPSRICSWISSGRITLTLTCAFLVSSASFSSFLSQLLPPPPQDVASLRALDPQSDTAATSPCCHPPQDPTTGSATDTCWELFLLRLVNFTPHPRQPSGQHTHP